MWRFDSNVGPENIDLSSFQGVEYAESPKQIGLNVSERREQIYALSKQPEEASELLNSWSRNEIMKIICAELGKERKYTGLAKPKLIENLLNLVSRPLGETSCFDRRNSRKKQKMTNYIICCENLACRAALGGEDTFCKRCSCCICNKFDDNKDPSLWLTCEACGLSCHLECGLKQERYETRSDDGGRGLDGRFYCAFCGKDNDLIGCWRKQVKVAKETRRVDVLCYRVSLGQKLLRGTRRYRNLLEFMDDAVKKLEGDVGPLSGWAMKMARGIVNRLASGSQVQKLCSLAMESLDKMVSVSRQGDKISVAVDEIQARSVTVRVDSDELSNRITGFRLFCQKSKEQVCLSEVNCVVHLPDSRSTIQGLEPETEFCIRVVSFNEEGDLDESELRFSTLKDEVEEAGNRQSPLTNSSSGLCSNPSLPEDESNNVCKSYNKENGDKYNIEVDSELENDRLVNQKADKIEGGDLLVTPCKRDAFKGKDRSLPEDESNHVCKSCIKENGDKGNTEHCSAGEVESELVNDRLVKRKADKIEGRDLLVTPCNRKTPKSKGRSFPEDESNLVCKNCSNKNSDKNNFEHCSAGEVESKLEDERLIKRKADKIQTPCKRDTFKGKDGGNKRSKSRTARVNKKPEIYEANKVGDKDLEHIVKTIRCLEQEGHIDKSFRERFLTWYSLRATHREVRIVKLFVETFMEDLSSLGPQLVDTFSECILSKRSSRTDGVPAGICLKLWH